MMRILYITGPGLGGSNVSLLTLLKQLQSVCDILVVTSKNDSMGMFSQSGIETRKVRFKFLMWPPISTLKDLILMPLRLVYYYMTNCLAFVSLVKICRQYKPDIIHTNVSTISVGYRVAKYLNIPHVWHIREYINKDFGFSPIPSFNHYKRLVSSGNTISISKDLVSHFGLSSACRVIYNGVAKPILMTNTQLKTSQRYFLFVGSIIRGKGIEELVNAYIKYFHQSSSPYELWVAGTGSIELQNKLSRQLSENGCDGVNFLGHRKDVAKLMSEASALIVPSVSEAFGRITAEAMLNYCVVIGKNVAGTKEQFDNGLLLHNKEIGIRYENECDLVRSLIEIEQSTPDRYDEMRTLAYKTVDQLYSPNNNFVLTYQFYKELADA